MKGFVYHQNIQELENYLSAMAKRTTSMRPITGMIGEKIVTISKESFEKELEYNKKVISIIDEPVVKIKLSEMISELEDKNDFQMQILDDEIKFLTNKRDKLK